MALHYFKEAIKVNPLNDDAYYNAAIIYWEKQDYSSAMEFYKKALDVIHNYQAFCNLGVCYNAKGLHDDAIKLFTKAVQINPKYCEAYNNLASTYRSQGLEKEAVKFYQKILELDPNHSQALHILASINGTTPLSAPKAYVENLFDSYAKNFEVSLINELKYNVPEIVKDLLDNQLEHYDHILDMGCGTGLVGLALGNGSYKRLDGVDVSKKMLEKASAKNIYTDLFHSDIVEYLKGTKLKYQLFIAADVFIYIGDLKEVFSLIKQNNENGGLIIFSTEHYSKSGYKLMDTGRFAHSKSYIETLSSNFNFKEIYYKTFDLRIEKNNIVLGGIYCLKF